MFLDIAVLDYSRRNKMLNQLTNALDLEFQKKEALTICYPTINFMDGKSLSTWLEARKITLSIGDRYKLRVHRITLVSLYVAGLLWFVVISSIEYINFSVEQ